MRFRKTGTYTLVLYCVTGAADPVVLCEAKDTDEATGGSGLSMPSNAGFSYDALNCWYSRRMMGSLGHQSALGLKVFFTASRRESASSRRRTTSTTKKMGMRRQAKTAMQIPKAEGEERVVRNGTLRRESRGET